MRMPMETRSRPPTLDVSRTVSGFLDSFLRLVIEYEMCSMLLVSPRCEREESICLGLCVLYTQINKHTIDENLGRVRRAR